MKKSLRSFVIFGSIFIFIVLIVTPVFASGSPQQELQVTQQSNGTMFVTTTPTQIAQSDNQTQPQNSPSIINANVVAPQGFAQNIGTVINFAIRAVMVLSILLVFGSLIWGGVEWITSGGDKTKTESARNRIVAAIIGLLVVVASYAIIVLLARILGFQDLNQAINSIGTINTTPAPTVIPTATPAPTFDPKASGSPIKQEKL